MGDVGTAASANAGFRRRTLLVLVLAAVSWWAVGFLPWLASGLSDPHAVPDEVGDPSRTALPLYPAHFADLYQSTVVGSLLAGLTGALIRDRPRTGVLASLGGVVVASTIALGQTVTAISRMAGDTYVGDDQLLSGLFLTTAATALVAWTIGVLSVRGRVYIGIALSVLTGFAAAWLSSVIGSFADTSLRSGAVDELLRWLTPALLAVALVVIGMRPYLRLLVWPVAVVLGWLARSTLAAAGGMDVYLRPPGFAADEALAASWDVFWLAADAWLVWPELRLWLLAIVVALIVAAFPTPPVRRVLGRS